MTETIRAFVVVTLLSATAIFGLSCGSTTAPSNCTNGPYTFDSNVQRCRASNGQFAENVCCGR